MLSPISALLEVLIFTFKVVIVGSLLVLAVSALVYVKEEVFGIWALHKVEKAKNKRKNDDFDEWVEDYRTYRETQAPHELPELESADPPR